MLRSPDRYGEAPKPPQSPAQIPFPPRGKRYVFGNGTRRGFKTPDAFAWVPNMYPRQSQSARSSAVLLRSSGTYCFFTRRLTKLYEQTATHISNITPSIRTIPFERETINQFTLMTSNAAIKAPMLIFCAICTLCISFIGIHNPQAYQSPRADVGRPSRCRGLPRRIRSGGRIHGADHLRHAVPSRLTPAAPDMPYLAKKALFCSSNPAKKPDGDIPRPVACHFFNTFSNSSSVSANTRSALSTVSGFVRSTPAIFSSSSG